MRFTNGLRAISLATIVTLVGVGTQAAPAVAADPTPTPTAPAADPTPTATPTAPAADPTPTAPAADPTPTPTASVADLIPAQVAPLATSADLTPTPAASSASLAAATTVAKPNLAARVVRIALAQRGKRYRYGATGPSAFDCSGLVLYAYRVAGVASHIGGGHSALGMLRWARARGLASRTKLQIGDIVIYGGGTHAAIYIGNGRVISALNSRQGIRITGLHALRASVTAYIHTHL